MRSNEPKYVTHLSLSFLVIAEFPDTTTGIEESKKYMAKHPKAGVLLTQDGVIVLSHCDDKGSGTGPSTVSGYRQLRGRRLPCRLPHDRTP